MPQLISKQLKSKLLDNQFPVTLNPNKIQKSLIQLENVAND